LKKVTTAFILGAGLGTRLRPLTASMPKPLLPIHGRPLITHIFDQLIQIGIERILVNTHHHAYRYAEAFPDSTYHNVPLIFRHEPILLETGGGIKNIEDLADPDSPLLIYNGDILSTLPLLPLIHEHQQSRREATLALRTQGEPRNVQLGLDGALLDFRYTFKNNGGTACLFTGIYLINPPFFQRLQPAQKESVIETFLRMIAEGSPPGGITLDQGSWSDIGSVEEYEKLKA